MFCKNCGQPLEDGTLFCPNCNTPVDGFPAGDTTQPQRPIYTANPYGTQPQQPYGAPQQPYGYPPQQPYPVQMEKPSITWLIVNIVCLVLSGSVFSIIGTVFGALAQSAYNKGAYADAQSKNKTAKILGIVSIVSLALVYILVFFFLIVGFSAMGPGYYS